MKTCKTLSRSFRILAFALALLLLVPTGARAEAQPRASNYLSTYSGYVSAAGNGLIHVRFRVEGTGIMDSVGVKSISIYESTDNSSWTWKATFNSSSTSGMVSGGTVAYSSSVSYQGVAGRYYRAYICVYASKNGGSDSDYFWTSTKKAT